MADERSRTEVLRQRIYLLICGPATASVLLQLLKPAFLRAFNLRCIFAISCAQINALSELGSSHLIEARLSALLSTHFFLNTSRELICRLGLASSG